jgi:hypothetical protein
LLDLPVKNPDFPELESEDTAMSVYHATEEGKRNSARPPKLSLEFRLQPHTEPNPLYHATSGMHAIGDLGIESGCAE